MALPELTLPAGTPAFSADGHSIELTPMFADVPMRTGHDRRRRVYTTVPRSVSVKLDLTLAQMAAFHSWYEGPLQAGAQSFSVQVANQGSGLLWWKARFVEPYTAEANESGQAFWVTAKLLLTGDGSVTGPYTPALISSIQVNFTGSVSVTSPIVLAADVVVALLSASWLGAAVTVAFVSILDGARPSAVDQDKRWIWMRYPYANGRTSDVTDQQEFDQRSWMGV